MNDDATTIYRASQLNCRECALKPRCCPEQLHRKVPRSIHEGARDLAREIARTDAYTVSYRRAETLTLL